MPTYWPAPCLSSLLAYPSSTYKKLKIRILNFLAFASRGVVMGPGCSVGLERRNFPGIKRKMNERNASHILTAFEYCRFLQLQQPPCSYGGTHVTDTPRVPEPSEGNDLGSSSDGNPSLASPALAFLWAFPWDMERSVVC